MLIFPTLLLTDVSDRLLLTCCYAGGSAAFMLLFGTLQVPPGDWLVALIAVFWLVVKKIYSLRVSDVNILF